MHFYKLTIRRRFTNESTLANTVKWQHINRIVSNHKFMSTHVCFMANAVVEK